MEPSDQQPASSPRPSPLERKASSEQLERLAQKGYLNLPGLERALTLAGYIPGLEAWRKFLDYTLLALGVAFALSGVIFFFAFNWAEMHRFLKFSPR
jgi:hypothetical protein